MIAARIQGPGNGGAPRPGAKMTFEVLPLIVPAANGIRMVCWDSSPISIGE